MSACQAMLSSREAPPMKDTIEGTQVFPMETTYTGNTGNDMGIHTMGFRANKYNPPEWQESNYGKYYQSFADRDNAEKVRFDSKRTIKEAQAQTDKTQAESTKKLAERLKDITFWKAELEREIGDMIDETDKLLAQKKRLENALRATEIPLHIATDNLNCRQRRQGVDLVQDEPELTLLKVCNFCFILDLVREKAFVLLLPRRYSNSGSKIGLACNFNLRFELECNTPTLISIIQLHVHW